MAARTIGKAYQLEAGAELKGLRTLTGEIVSIDTPYSEEYGNVTVTIVVGGPDRAAHPVATAWRARARTRWPSAM